MISVVQVSSPNPVCTSPLPDTCHMPRLSNYSWFDHPKKYPVSSINYCAACFARLLRRPP